MVRNLDEMVETWSWNDFNYAQKTGGAIVLFGLLLLFTWNRGVGIGLFAIGLIIFGIGSKLQRKIPGGIRRLEYNEEIIV